MATLLKIDVSPRGNQSISRQLGEQFAASWLARNPDGKIVTRDLTTTQIPFVDEPWIGGAFTPPQAHTEDHKAALKISDTLTHELLDATEVLITTPFYNFTIPATLKAWIDQVVRPGLTFNPQTYEGLAKGRKTTVIVSSGGNYGPSNPRASMDHLTPYLKTVFGFIGITDVVFKPAYDTSSIMKGEITPEKYLEEHAVAAD
jgi:FMN-dependent NADH-azoreductase